MQLNNWAWQVDVDVKSIISVHNPRVDVIDISIYYCLNLDGSLLLPINCGLIVFADNLTIATVFAFLDIFVVYHKLISPAGREPTNKLHEWLDR